MNDKLREYVEQQFANAPKTKQTVEIKEEILQNTIDRYNDLIAEGKSEQAAFNIAVAGIGDIENLIGDIKEPVPGYTQQQILKERRRSALLLSVSIMLYILCVVPVIMFDDGGTFGVVMMFVMIAAATGLIIYRSKTAFYYKKTDDTVVENFKEWSAKKNEDSSLVKAVTSAVWALTLVAYFLISFLTRAWYLTWLIFFIGGAVSNIVRAVFDLKK